MTYDTTKTHIGLNNLTLWPINSSFFGTALLVFIQCTVIASCFYSRMSGQALKMFVTVILFSRKVVIILTFS